MASVDKANGKVNTGGRGQATKVDRKYATFGQDPDAVNPVFGLVHGPRRPQLHAVWRLLVQRVGVCFKEPKWWLTSDEYRVRYPDVGEVDFIEGVTSLEQWLAKMLSPKEQVIKQLLAYLEDLALVKLSREQTGEGRQTVVNVHLKGWGRKGKLLENALEARDVIGQIGGNGFPSFDEYYEGWKIRVSAFGRFSEWSYRDYEPFISEKLIQHDANRWRMAMGVQPDPDTEKWLFGNAEARIEEQLEKRRAVMSEGGRCPNRASETGDKVLPKSDDPNVQIGHHSKTDIPEEVSSVKTGTGERPLDVFGSGGQGDSDRQGVHGSPPSGNLGDSLPPAEVARQADQEPAESLLVPSGEPDSGHRAPVSAGVTAFPQLDFSGEPSPSTQKEREAARTRERHENAKVRLATTDDPCVTIASDLGYSDSQHLSHDFKAREGTSPTEYRNRAREAEVKA